MIWASGAYLGILGHRKRLAVESGGRKKQGGRKGEGGGGGGKEWFHKFHSGRSWSPPWNVEGPLIGACRWTATMSPEAPNWAAMGLKFF
ncbi:hypothetical protein BHE74_00037325 [Ensete ventricosum]|nr:hypothetical protein BHE74_00037325 [Ensete ventricosum]